MPKQQSSAVSFNGIVNGSPLFYLLIIEIYVFVSVSSQCSAQPMYGLSAPKFLCGYQDGVIRLTGWSSQVFDRVALPHNHGNAWLNEDPYFELHSINTTSIAVTRERISTQSTLRKSTKSRGHVTQSNEDVHFDLSYIMDDGLTIYKARFLFTNESDTNYSENDEEPQFNLLSWNLGAWDKEVDSLTVSFKSEDIMTSLTFANKDGTSEKGLQLPVKTVNVNTPVSFHLLETNTNACSLKHVAEKPASRNWRSWILLPGGGLVCLVILAILRLFRSHSESSSGDDSDTSSTMEVVAVAVVAVEVVTVTVVPVGAMVIAFVVVEAVAVVVIITEKRKAIQ